MFFPLCAAKGREVSVVNKSAESSVQISGTIFNIQRFSVHDGPGIRTLVFLKGCPLHCLWCSNPESQNRHVSLGYTKTRCIGCNRCVETCPTGAIKNGSDGKIIERSICTLCGICAKNCCTGALEMLGENITVAEVMDEILKDSDIYRNSGGGVTIGGGEPTTQPEFAASIFRTCQSSGIHTAMETCGFAPWSVYETVLPHLNLVMYDIKHMDPDEHFRFTGQTNEKILDNLRRIAKMGKEIIIRVPLIPGINDLPENIHKMGRFLQENRLSELHLLPYHKLGVNKYETLGLNYQLDATVLCSDQLISEVKSTLESYNVNVTVYSLL